MIPEHRRSQIIDLVGRHHQRSVEDLSETLKVSRETIRRDLTILEERGHLRKVHGGAINIQTASETAVAKRRTTYLDEKRRIGRYAAGLFSAGDTLMVDAGTTTAIFAQELSRLEGLKVITNSVEVATSMSLQRGVNQVFLLGGGFYGEVGETLGSITVEQISQYRADHAVLTVGAIDSQGGFMDFDVEEATVAKAIIQQSRAVTVIADHSKMGRQAMAKVCDLSTVDRLVTDRAIAGSVNEALSAARVEVLVVDE